MKFISNITEEEYNQIEKGRQKSSYFKPQDIEDNKTVKIRFLDNAVGFYEGWLKEGVRTGENANQPVRWEKKDPWPQYEKSDWDRGKYDKDPIQFKVCAPIWNFSSGELQMITIQQQGLQNTFISLNEKYDDLRSFDLEIKKEVKGGRTSYVVNMIPGTQANMKDVIEEHGLAEIPCEPKRMITLDDPFADDASTLDLSFFMGGPETSQPEPTPKPESTPKPEPQTEPSLERWREVLTKTGQPLGSLSQEKLIEIRNTMREKGLTENPKYKYIDAAVRELMQASVQSETSPEDLI